MFERLSSLTLTEGIALFSATIGAVSLGIVIGGWWSRRREAKKQQRPRIEMIIGASPGGLHLGEWRHAVLTIFNRSNANIRLVAIRRKRPYRLRLFRFANHQTAPVGAPAKEIEADLLIYGAGRDQPTQKGFEFLFRLPESPPEDSGIEIKCVLRFIDLDNGGEIYARVKKTIP